MGKKIDLSGKRFGTLVVISRNGTNKHRHSTWNVVCDCGKQKVMDINAIKRAKSCGCQRNVGNKGGTKHGKSNSRLYGIWKHMRLRCDKKHASKYPRYAGRGIAVCEEWNDWPSFERWAMSNGYSDDLSIDRIDNDGNYEPSNCRWADGVTQQNNQSNNVFVNYQGQTLTIAQLARQECIHYQQLRDNIRDNGMSVEEAVERGKRNRNGALYSERRRRQ